MYLQHRLKKKVILQTISEKYLNRIDTTAPDKCLCTYGYYFVSILANTPDIEIFGSFCPTCSIPLRSNKCRLLELDTKLFIDYLRPEQITIASINLKQYYYYLLFFSIKKLNNLTFYFHYIFSCTVCIVDWTLNKSNSIVTLFDNY